MFPPLADILKGTVEFDFYRDGMLYYHTVVGDFRFSVPVSDTGTGTFLRHDKAIFFMRWIKPQYEEYTK